MHVIIIYIDLKFNALLVPSTIQMALFWYLKILPDIMISSATDPRPFPPFLFPLLHYSPLCISHWHVSRRQPIPGITFSWGFIASALVVNDSFSCTSESEAGGALRQGWTGWCCVHGTGLSSLRPTWVFLPRFHLSLSEPAAMFISDAVVFPRHLISH